MNKEKSSFYKEHPKTCSPIDFWGQVKRTVNGTPVPQDQIDMIEDAVLKGLDLTPEDNLLDICCGNGALSTLFFRHCNNILGVDFSEPLISIANKNFANPPNETYILGDVIDFCENPITPDKFTKLLCYGSFSYIDFEKAESMLVNLKKNFSKLERIFIGNCPDKNHFREFYGNKSLKVGLEDDPNSPIGIWRTSNEFISMANHCGWQAEISKMPNQYYAAHYRYDVILTK